MSHHWNEDSRELNPALKDLFVRSAMDDELARLKQRFGDAADRFAAGAVASYPDGKLDAGDKGQFRYAVDARREAQIVRIDFGAPVSAIGLTLEEAETLMEELRRATWALRGIDPPARNEVTQEVAQPPKADTREVYSEPECVFCYCPYPSWCKQSGCQHAVKPTTAAPSKE